MGTVTGNISNAVRGGLIKVSNRLLPVAAGHRYASRERWTQTGQYPNEIAMPLPSSPVAPTTSPGRREK